MNVDCNKEFTFEQIKSYFFNRQMRNPPRAGSFQEQIIEYLKGNLTQSYTCEELIKKFGRSQGSTSGTLGALIQNGWLKKSRDYPARYSYLVAESTLSPNQSADVAEHEKMLPSQKAIASKFEQETLEQETLVDQTIADFLERKVEGLKQEIQEVDEKIEELQRQLEELQRQRAKLSIKLEAAYDFKNEN